MNFRSLCQRSSLWLVILSSCLPMLARADKLADVLKRGYVIVGTTSATPPFGYKDEKGELVGFDIDMSRLIAKALFGDADKVKFELISNELRWPALQNDQVDLVAHATTITPSRLVRAAFTPRYFDTGMTIAVRSDSKIKLIADLNDPKMTLATLTVPEGIDVAKRMAPNATIASFGAVDQQSLALRSGRVDAFLVDLPIGMWYAATSSEIRILPQVYGGYQNYGIAYKLGELSWSQFLDGFVTELTTGYTYTEYTRLYQKYFKVNPPPQRGYKVLGLS